MTCPEQPLISFLAGELSAEEERRFDDHLLTCDECWRAVQADQTAGLALEGLRLPAPAGLQGRVTAAVALAIEAQGPGGDPAPAPETVTVGPDEPAGPEAEPALVALSALSGSGRRSRALAALRWSPSRLPVPVAAAVGLLVAVAAGGLVWAAGNHHGPSDPPQVAAVVAMMTPGSPPTTALRAGERFVIAGQPLMVHAYELEGTEELVATSAVPFPMPAPSHLLSGSSAKAWMATKGDLSMYGVNRPRGHQSMFLIAQMPMADMPQMAARLKLI